MIGGKASQVAKLLCRYTCSLNVNQLKTATASEQITKTMSMIILAYLNGARFSIPAKPKIRSAAKITNTMTAIVKAVIQRPFCTGEIPQTNATPIGVERQYCGQSKTLASQMVNRWPVGLSFTERKPYNCGWRIKSLTDGYLVG